MADTKISGLPASTTPLAGTEVLPIVQSGSTRQVSVANLTTGRTQTSNGIVQGTAGTGYNFTANTPAAGMTSQLLNWYEEGTWTPTVSAAAGTITSYTSSGYYTRNGRQITVNGTFTITNNGTGSAAILIAGMPFSIANSVAGGIAREGAVNGLTSSITANGTTGFLMQTYDNNYPGATNASFQFSVTYFV